MRRRNRQVGEPEEHMIRTAEDVGFWLKHNSMLYHICDGRRRFEMNIDTAQCPGQRPFTSV